MGLIIYDISKPLQFSPWEYTYIHHIKEHSYACEDSKTSGIERWFILVPLRHLHTNAKPKFITAMDRCFNARHRSSNPVSARETLTTAPPKFVQRLITARAKLVKQRWSTVQDFCVGLADPSVHELASSGAKL
ncbi:hypothetical protein MAR_035919 [Mya arenaria]|uniref:Uncharacterized protein n=1 Tax=Mya arenaria TaxID=6604 RepID=A0ABY7ELI4_MYAAR|nr:hypothetical protein MAR_035919 [Mya arenaria]